MYNIKEQFLLNPGITFLNHGSFGACPKPIFESYQQWQRDLEAEPIQFLTKKYYDALAVSKQMLAAYINCDAQDFFFLQNPTTAINQVVKSLGLKQGDEVLTTNHEYGAMDKTFDFYSKKYGFVNRRQNISLPLLSKEQFIEEFWKGYNERTRAIFISHCTSTTALVFPVKEICDRAKELGLIAIVDGAHVPGHVPLNIKELKADFYTGTVHKWLLSPKGCTFLYVDKDYQNSIEPLIISWGYETAMPTKSKFLEENEMQGTRDATSYLTIPAIMKFFDEHNMKERLAACRQTILEQYPVFCELLKTKPLCKLSGEFSGQMCSIPIQTENPFQLKETLYNKYKIEIPVMQRAGETYLRISYQVYNTPEELEYLKETLQQPELGLM
ncbi:aminotransferase class V-fold PLP-dependent enzyme [Parafilimonas terrae]|uniref:Isopenicillin-N epimerase n=1 Tax=Parafilimonas terrae TaxID=1465490 RepID=A0A1I5YGH4_9BACT|nr:aminotransferase class V-fold PLP-dependent enzyme [Parafilimonas terrae]SFQ43319.1 isopenicillin-N epimerase [Parafilimonas terrae]